MNPELFTPSNITFGLGILGIIFAVYRYFKEPQVDSDKKDALLAQQVQWEREATAVRFKEMQESFQNLLLQSNNHIHTVDVKVESLKDSVALMGNQIVKLATIIEERIPPK